MRSRPSVRSRVIGFARIPIIRAFILLSFDSAVWLIALASSTAARWEFHYSSIDIGGLLLVATVAIASQTIWGLLVGLYPGRWRLGSFNEVGLVGVGATIIGAGLFVWIAGTSGTRPVPISAAIVGPSIFFLLALGPRFAVRMLREQRQISRHTRTRRALLFGAGEAGHEVIRALSRDSQSDIEPMAFLDDDPRNARLRIGRCRVVGDRNHIAAAAAQFEADTLVITMPSAPRADVAAIAKSAQAAGLEVLILPTIALSLNGEVKPDHLRPLQFDDFLGREPVTLDIDQMRSFIKGRRVLVTGAGGSIGSELCAAVERLEPAELTMLDRDENALHAVQLRLEGRALLDSERLVIADIRDAARIREVFEQCRPEIVFHAAALKHVTFLERFPLEAVKTNVLGTRNLLEAARLTGVERFINISTDKAADPINVLGYTKRIGERLTSGFGSNNGEVAVSVRFGNVLGSNGSVIPSMRQQILSGGPVTVTHPEVTRFFMTTREAVDLVIQAGAIGNHGEAMVLDMGEPVRIVDLAHDLIVQLKPDGDVEIEITGLRPGEKLHEVLTHPDEDPIRRPHDGITSYGVPRLHPSGLTDLDTDSSELVRVVLRRLARDGF